MRLRRKTLWMMCLTAVFAVARSVHAQDVGLDQTSSPPGLFAPVSSTVQSGSEARTIDAPFTIGNLVFVHWEVNGVRIDDAARAPLNPAVFTIISPSTAVAVYMNPLEDADSDGVPDWYELWSYTSLVHDAASDTDGDGFTLAAEYQRHLRPGTPNTPEGGGISIRKSPRLVVTVNPNYFRFDERSVRGELWTPRSRGVSNGTFAATAVAPLFVQGHAFSEWRFNGVRQANANGVAVEVAGTVVTTNIDATAQYILISEDVDEDGIPDWKEIRDFGRLDEPLSSDADGDGLSVIDEHRRDTSPVIRSVFTHGGIAHRRAFFQIDWGGPPPPVDFDGIPDAWEIMHFGHINHDGDSDSDGDGWTLAQEYRYDLNPTLRNDTQHGGVSDRKSARIFANIAGWPTYAFRYEPGGLVESSGGVAAPGSIIHSPVFAGLTAGRAFVHWIQDGQRRIDGAGVALGGLIFSLNHNTEAVAHFMDPTLDTDADGYKDWFEIFHTGTLQNQHDDDLDNDGFTLAEEYRRDQSPSIRNATQYGGISERSSPVLRVDLQFFPPESDVLIGGLPQALFSTPNSTGTLQEVGNTAPAVGDWDGDGDDDMFVGARNGVMRFFANEGSPVIVNFVNRDSRFTGVASAWTGITSPSPALGDWSGDGIADLAIGGDGGVIKLLRSNGSFSNPTSGVTTQVVVAGTLAMPAFGDVSGDGRLDLLVLKDNGTVDAFFNTGSANAPYGAVASLTSVLGLTVPNGTGISVADVNRDGKTDILVSDNEGSIWRFDQTTSPSTYVIRNKIFGGSHVGFAERLTISVSDLDGDGDEDIIAGNKQGTLFYLRDPAPKLTIVPPGRSLLVGERQPFALQDGRTNIVWRLHVNRSGGMIDPTNGLYTAGTNASVVDVIEADDGNLIGRAYANVLGIDDITRAGKAVIVAGGKSLDDPVWHATDHVADFAYNTLRYRGFSRENIEYLSFQPNQDADLNGLFDDIDGYASSANLSAVFTNWVAPADKLFVYFADHGSDAEGQGFFRLNSTEIVPATLVAQWLNDLQDANTNLDVTVVLDFCYAGSFVDELAYTGTAQRIVIASTASDELTYFIAGGLISFSDVFFSALLQSFNLELAFNIAREAMLAYQHATMDDNRDGVYNAADGPVAATVIPGASFVIGRDVPVIGSVAPNITIEGATATVWAKDISSVYPLGRVWCSILAPGHRPNAAVGIPVVDVPEVDLTYNPILQRYEATLSGFTESGTYQINYSASDIWGGVSFPKNSFVHQGGFDERLILVAGGTLADPDWPAYEYMADLVYRTFRIRSLRPECIQYLSASPGRDLDGFGTNAVDATVSLAAIENAITGWAAGADKVTLYMIGDSSNGAFRVDHQALLTPVVLDAWLDTLQVADVDVTCVMDFDRSGGYISTNTLAPPDRKRVQIASTRTYRESLAAAGGTLSFTQYFMTQIFGGNTVGDAYNRARKTLRRASGNVRQRTLLDDNANAKVNEKNVEGLVARKQYFGSAFVTGDDAPLIGSVISPTLLGGASNLLIWARDVIDVNGISNVWCVVTPPGYVATGSVERVDLVYNVSTMRYEATLTNLVQPGTYQLTFYAMDTLGELSDAVQSEITKTDAYEPDDTHATATLYVGQPQFHSFHTSNDVDWIRFFAVSNFVYDIETFHFGTNIDTVVEVFREEVGGQLTPVDYVDDFGFDEGELTGLNFPRSGWYAVKVSQFTQQGWGPGTYDLLVTIPVGAGGHLVVLGADLFNGTSAPPGLTATASGPANEQLAFHNGNSVTFVNLPSGDYQVEVPDVPGYEPDRDPDVPDAHKNPDSELFGNPRNIAVANDEWNMIIFAFVPVVYADGFVRDAHTGIGISGAQVRFTARSGPLDGTMVDHFPAGASYGDPWYSDSNGQLPTNVILPRAAWDVHVDHAVYSNVTYTFAIREPITTLRTNLGNIVMLPQDTNTNGVDDLWEAFYFPGGGFDALNDADGDGANNRHEYLAGSNPTNRFDVMKVLAYPGSSESHNGWQAILIWFARAGRSYVVDTSSDLILNRWAPVTTPILHDESKWVLWVDTNSVPDATRLYRLRLARP